MVFLYFKNTRVFIYNGTRKFEKRLLTLFRERQIVKVLIINVFIFKVQNVGVIGFIFKKLVI